MRDVFVAGTGMIKFGRYPDQLLEDFVPPAIKEAFDDSGKLVVLRPGTNGWFCLPDDPATRLNNPMCNDQVWMDFIYALVAGEAPTVTKPGFSYLMAHVNYLRHGRFGVELIEEDGQRDSTSRTWLRVRPVLPAGKDTSNTAESGIGK